MYIFFKIILTKVSNANIYMYKQFYISFKIILHKSFLVFKKQGLYCHELIFCKWNFFEAEQISWNRGTSINTSCATHKRRAPQGKIFVLFLQDTLKTVFQMRI